MTTQTTGSTLENRAYDLIKERISKDSSPEKFHEELGLIKWVITSYSKIGRIDEAQKKQLSNMLIERALEYSSMRATERFLDKMRIKNKFRSAIYLSYPIYSPN